MPERARDAPPVPLFTTHVEAKAMEALNVLMLVHGAGGGPLREGRLAPLRAGVTRIVDCLFPATGDSADFSGITSVDGSDYVHPIKVAALAAVIGRFIGMPRSALINLTTSAALMNVGYLALRRSILDEPRHLLDGEWEQTVHTHPGEGVALLAHSGLPEHCLKAIAQHHERWDGSGYPDRLRSEAISLDARILAVADTYISLRSLRPYRQAVDAVEALQEIASESGRLFDPEVIDAFEEVIARYTGVTLPGRAASPDPAPDEEPPNTQRDDVDRAGRPLDADTPVRDTGDATRQRDSRAGARPVLAPPAERTAPPRRRPPPAPAGATRPPPGVTVPTPLQPPLPARRRRPRTRRKSTLFATGLYVDAAVRGGWSDE